jgi:hypothetical protein
MRREKVTRPNQTCQRRNGSWNEYRFDTEFYGSNLDFDLCRAALLKSLYGVNFSSRLSREMSYLRQLHIQC